MRGSGHSADFFMFITALGGPGSSSNMIGPIPTERTPAPLSPRPHPQKYHQTGAWEGIMLGVFIPPKNLPNKGEQLEK